MGEKEFTHLTETGVHMVEVGEKPQQRRTAKASGKIHLQKETIDMIKNLTTAQIAGIQAVKKTSDIIPLCHPLNLSGIEIEFEVGETEITATCECRLTGQTGVEMEAITGVSVALLTIWDMTKAVEKDENGQYPDTKISDIVVLKKEKI